MNSKIKENATKALAGGMAAAATILPIGPLPSDDGQKNAITQRQSEELPHHHDPYEEKLREEAAREYRRGKETTTNQPK